MKRLAILAASAIATMTFVDIGRACSVPVFRYALERWTPDSYRIIMFRDKELTEAEKQAMDKIAKAGDIGYGPPPVVSADVNVNEELPDYAKELWKAHKDKPLPHMVVQFPAFYEIEEPLWSGPLTIANTEAILQSAVRKDIGRRLVEGDSAVWVFFESKDAKKNKAAMDVLTQALKTAHEEMKLPHEFDEEDTEYDTDMSEGVELKLSFSVVTVKADDEGENILRGIVQAFDAKIADRMEPALVPVFGRARALISYLGEEITEENVLDACFFLIGPCSCQVKGMNPGLDLLVPQDWDELITGMMGAEEELPPLTVPTAAPPAEGETGDVAAPAEGEDIPPGGAGEQATDDQTASTPPEEDTAPEAAVEQSSEEPARSVALVRRSLVGVLVLGIAFVLVASAFTAGRSES